MKRIILFICLHSLALSLFFTMQSCKKTPVFENPITSITLNHSTEISLEVGETFSIDCDVTPATTDQPLEITTPNTSVIEIKDNLIQAKSTGTARVDIQPKGSDNSNLKKTLNITVISDMDQSKYESKHKAQVNQATFQLRVICYDGFDSDKKMINESIYEKPATIIRQSETGYYFIVHESVFSKTGMTKYWEIKLIAPDGTEYSVNNDIKKITETRLCIGSFNCDFAIVPSFVGQYSFLRERIAIYNGNQFLFSYIKSKGMEKFNDTVARQPAYYADFKNYPTSLIGAAVYNKDGDMIGIVDSYSTLQITVIDVSLINEAIDRIIDHKPAIQSNHING